MVAYEWATKFKTRKNRWLNKNIKSEEVKGILTIKWGKKGEDVSLNNKYTP